MFKRFSVDEHVSTSSKIKSSQQRSIRSKVVELYPDLEPFSEMLMPKKAPMVVAKWCAGCCLIYQITYCYRTVLTNPLCYTRHSHNHIQIVLHEGEPVFFNQRDGPFMPTLKLLHKGT